jgi:O-methyltransferase
MEPLKNPRIREIGLEQRGESAAAVELRRLFPGVQSESAKTDAEHAAMKRSQARAPRSAVDVLSAFNFLKNTRFSKLVRPFRRGVEGIEGYLRANGVVIRPLVPEAELSACQRHAIDVLSARDPHHTWGDYLEFGVFQGHSISLMFRNLAALDLLDKVRLYGFDSFEGYPPEALDEPENNFMPGGDKAKIRVAQKVLTSRAIDWSRVKLVKGWFADTLTPGFREREKITRVSLVNFDCDLYLSTAQALAFVAPLVCEAAIFFFDDWGRGEEMINQKRAFVEYLEDNPTVHAEELPNYSWESRVFLITRNVQLGLSWQQRTTTLDRPQ